MLRKLIERFKKTPGKQETPASRQEADKPAAKRKPRNSGDKPAPARKSRKPAEKPSPAKAAPQSPSPGGGQKRSRKPKPRPAWSLDQFQVPPEEGKVRFHDLSIPLPIMHAICDLGFEYCTPIQAQVLAKGLEGRNLAGRAQTGTGKTAAFLISMFTSFLAHPHSPQRRNGTPRVLVLAPTRELVIQIAKDADALSKYAPIRSLAVYGGMDYERQQRELEQKKIDLIAATPGRLLDFLRKRKVDLSQVEVLIIDEADRMLDMGFIPDVRRIIRALPPKQKRRSMLFSATLTREVLRLASEWMPDPHVIEIEPEQVAVDTVEQIVYSVVSAQKFRLLYNILKQDESKRVLVFANRRDGADRLMRELQRHGMPCQLLSGAVDQKKRLRILNDFKAGNVRIVVATDVAGRGIHVDDVSHVINYDFPYEPEDYVHRIGRTGRAGADGTAISFACEDESFVIPEIEEYIGQELPCKVPAPELLVDLPEPTAPAPRRERRPPRDSRGRDRRGPRRPPRRRR